MQKYHFKDITLLITHYNRSSSLKRLLTEFRNLDCQFGEIVVSDDGSIAEHFEQLIVMQKQYQFRLISTPVNKGLGNNLNKGQDAVQTDYTLYVQEDFVPAQIFPEKLDDAVDFMNEDTALDMVRFYAYFKYPYLRPFKSGFSRMIFSLWYPGYRKFYYYSDHPHLRRSSFFTKFGRYAENTNPDKTEYKMMMSFLKLKGKALFYDDYQSLFTQINSNTEPSTIKRHFWRESNNPFITTARHLYRHIKFNLDIQFRYSIQSRRLIMYIFDIPQWVKPHLYPNKNFSDLTEQELDDLKRRLQRFKAEQPEISVVIPAWNEESNIYRTLSSLADSSCSSEVEIIVINNNSSDRTSYVLDRLGVRTYHQPIQGTAHARQLGLMMARGKYHLCADADSFYPPRWISLMVKPLRESRGIVGVYGRYSFIPSSTASRPFLFLYEKIAGILVRLRKINREYINVLGFNMGFITEIGRNNGGFEVEQVRKFDNAQGSSYFVDEAEDGRMAINLKKSGKLKLITHPAARVFTSSRRLMAEGGISQSFVNRLKLHLNRAPEYLRLKK